jgi:serine/threonine-protein kinase
MAEEFVEGQVLDGKYRIERVIGRGGMGVVVGARHLGLDEQVAIKFLSEQAWMNSEVVARFEREARAAVKIKSEHVVRVIDVGRLASGAPYMVMEYLQGEDLAARLAQRGPFPVEQAADFMLHACVALAGAHAAGIVHRDIKPGNLFCTVGSDGQLLVKVLDFGISKLTEAAQRGDGLSVTKTAALLGSPLYMSPEQIRSSKDVDLRTDIWSLGVVLFELLTGQVPFPGESFGEVAIKVATVPMPPLVQFRRDIPSGLDAVIGRCLEKERQHRFADIGELAQSLVRYASRSGQLSMERISRLSLSGSGAISGGGFALTQSASESVTAKSAQEQSRSYPGAGRLPGGMPETVSAWGDGNGVRRSSRRAVIGTTAAVTVALGIIGAVVFRHTLTPGTEPSSSSVAAPQPTPEPASPPTVVPPVVSAAPPAPAFVDPEPTAAAPTPAPLPADPEPTAEWTQNKRAVPGRHTSRPSSALSHTTSPTPVPSPAPSPRPEPAHPPDTATAKPAAPKPDCDPPFVLDDQGRKRFKPECFK